MSIQESEEKNCPTERKEEIVIIIKSKTHYAFFFLQINFLKESKKM